jgi:spore coat polysaccharide biosynthesis protein SpsF
VQSLPEAGGVVVIVQARMGSSRLPGKVLMPVAGRPLLSYLLERLRRVRLAEQIVVATSTDPRDDAIVAACDVEQVRCHRGSELDVLTRFVETAQAVGARTVVRLTADCPLIDPGLVDDAVRAFSPAARKFDYLSNMLEPSWPYGMAVEVFTASALYDAGREATDSEEREHVTPFIWRRPQRYRLKSLTMTPDLSWHRWTVDTPEDFELVSRILGALYPRKPDFRMADVIRLLEENPDWPEVNSQVVQRQVASKGANP